jgi:RNA polymerase sigma factor (sigma-70 family)
MEGVCDRSECRCPYLVSKVLDGDCDAAAKLILELTPLVRSSVRRQLGRFSEEVDDVCQEAFVKAFARLETWNKRGPFCHWLIVVATNGVRDFKRRLVRQRSVFSSNLTAVDAEEPPSRRFSYELRECIERAVEQLDEPERRVVELINQGHTRAEIALMLDISDRNLQYRLKRICERLRHCEEK